MRRWLGVPAIALGLALVAVTAAGGVPGSNPAGTGAGPSGTEELFAAVRAGNLKGVRAQLDRGVDPSARDSAGQTPLHIAAYNGDWQVVSALLAKGADPAAADATGLTPLHTAALRGKAEAVAALLSRGAPVDPRDPVGLTPLHYAALHGRYDAAVALLDRGADPLAQDPAGLTPAALAGGEDQAELAALLSGAARAARAARKAAAPQAAPPGTAVRAYDDSNLSSAGTREHGFTEGGFSVQTGVAGGAPSASSYRPSPGPSRSGGGVQAAALRRQLRELRDQLAELRSNPPEKNTAYGVQDGNLTRVYTSSEVRQAYERALRDLQAQIAKMEAQLRAVE